ncbi:MAG: DUF1285 domain-containing protein [Alphaproteobacteria bacterium]
MARDGTWFYHGSPIGRKAITKLFATVLRREDDGSYWLVTPAERGRIDVDEVPFVAIDMTVESAGRGQRLIFTTNLDETVVAGPAHRLWLEPAPAGEEGVRPYVHVRDGLVARLSRPVFYRLAELAEADDDGTPGVWSDGAFFALAAVGQMESGERRR